MMTTTTPSLTNNRLLRAGLLWLALAALCWLLPGGTAWAAAPSIAKITMLPSRHLELQLAVDTGESYVFQISTNLTDWMAVGGISQAPTNSITVVDENTVDLAPALFFRFKVGRYTRFSFGCMHSSTL